MIEKITDRIIDILRDEIRSKFTIYEDQITSGRLDKEDNDTVIGLYLYNILNIDQIQNREPFYIKDDHLETSPKVIELSYLVYVNNKASMKQLTLNEEMLLLEEVTRIFFNHSMIEIDDIQVHLSFEDISLHEKIGLWQAMDIAYQNAVYIRVAPVVIRSMQDVTFKRIQTRQINMEVKEDE